MMNRCRVSRSRGERRSRALACVTLLVVAALLAGAGTASADVPGPLISPEIALDQPIPTEPAGDQGDPSIACEGDLCLVAWLDHHEPKRVWAARVTAGGDVLDPEGIRLADLPGSLQPQFHRPRVAAGGGLFLVVFNATTEPALVNGSWEQSSHLRGVRVTPDGVVLDPDGIAITAPSPYGFVEPIATHVAGNFMLFWPQGELQPMRRARVAPDGTVLDPDGATLPATGYPKAVASDGSAAYLLWYGDGALRGSPIDAQGDQLDPAGLELVQGDSPWTASGALAFDGSSYVAVWSVGSERRAWAARVTPAGALLDPAPILVTDTWIDVVLGAASDGTTTFVLAREQSCGDDQCSEPVLRLARLDGGGVPLDLAAPLISAYSYDGAIAAGSRALATWLAPSPDACKQALKGARLLPAGAPVEGEPFPLHRSVNRQETPSAAWNGQSHLVVWADSRQNMPQEPPGAIYAVRVSPEAEILDPWAIPIATGLTSHPRAIFNGASTTVSWTAYGCGDGWFSDRYAARVSAEGAVLDAAPVPIPGDPIGAAPGGGVLLMGLDESGPYPPQPVLWRLGSDNSLSGPTSLSGLTLGLYQYLSGVSSDGEGYLLLIDDVQADILYGALMSPEGVILPPGLFPVRQPLHAWHRVGFGGDVHVVLSLQQTPVGYEVRAARVSPTDGPLDPLEGLLVATHEACLTCGASPFQPDLAVAPAPGGALLTWSAPASDAGAFAIHGAVLDGAGALGPVVTLAEAPGSNADHVLSADDSGGVLLAYQRTVDDGATRAPRIRARLLGECGPATCPTGTCVGGVCCASPDECLPVNPPDPPAPPPPPAPPDPCAGGACAPADDPVQFSGCGCRLAPAGHDAGALLALAALALLRRRRRGRDAAFPA